VLTPEGPAGTAIRQAVLDDQADGGVDDASGVVAAGIGQVGHVGVEILAAFGAEMLRVDQEDVTGSAGEGIAQVMESAASDVVAVGAMTAVWTGTPAVIAVLAGDLGLGQVVDACGALGGVGAVFSGCGHGWTPGKEALPGITQLDGDLFTKFSR
jgi:D-arabinose 1-dehydrogenase-like Zn-dependent alcohol dehydrogenase